MEGSAPVDRPREFKGPHLQGSQNIAAGPVVFNLIVDEREGENYILVFHPDAGIPVDGVKFARQDRHDRTCLNGTFAGADCDGSAAFNDINDLHLLMPVEVYPGKVLGNCAEICVVSKARLLVQQGFFILGVFFEIHWRALLHAEDGLPQRSGSAEKLRLHDKQTSISLLYYFML